jgi:hypothetical protein
MSAVQCPTLSRILPTSRSYCYNCGYNYSHGHGRGHNYNNRLQHPRAGPIPQLLSQLWL